MSASSGAMPGGRIVRSRARAITGYPKVNRAIVRITSRPVQHRRRSPAPPILEGKVCAATDQRCERGVVLVAGGVVKRRPAVPVPDVHVGSVRGQGGDDSRASFSDHGGVMKKVSALPVFRVVLPTVQFDDEFGRTRPDGGRELSFLHPSFACDDHERRVP